VIGAGGRGCLDLFQERPDVITGGFGKAFGAFGGFVVANEAMTEVINSLGRQNINTSNLSPIMAAQALINLRHYRANLSEIQGTLVGKLRLFNEALSAYGLASYADPDRYIHPIFCLYQKQEQQTLENFRELISEGFLPSFFPPPVATYPSLRFSLHRLLPDEELLRLAKLLGEMKLSCDPGRAA